MEVTRDSFKITTDAPGYKLFEKWDVDDAKPKMELDIKIYDDKRNVIFTGKLIVKGQYCCQSGYEILSWSFKYTNADLTLDIMEEDDFCSFFMDTYGSATDGTFLEHFDIWENCMTFDLDVKEDEIRSRHYW